MWFLSQAVKQLLISSTDMLFHKMSSCRLMCG